MTPPIGHPTGSPQDDTQLALFAVGFEGLRRPSDHALAPVAPTQAFDYAYRIAALTVGLALVTSLL